MLYKSTETPSIESMLEYARELGLLRQEYDLATSYYQKLKAISRFYLRKESELINHYNETGGRFLSYPLDWSDIHTPIETEAWHSIRRYGVPLYPQYPVLNYHIDFANPAVKIGLELDGKDFHDVERDTLRDENLKKIGWTIYRISGSEMNKSNYLSIYQYRESELNEDEVLDYVDEWLMNTGDGVIHAIRDIHFQKGSSQEDLIEKRGYKYFQACQNTLLKHRLA